MIALNKKNNKGVTVAELLIAIAILGILSGIVINSLVSFRKNQALQKDTELVVELLNQARNQTISTKNLSQYGVHFTSTTVTIFTGPTYSNGATGNQVFTLNSTDTILSITLTGGGSDVIFNRLTGETSQNGTIVVSSPGITETKTVTIYKTGVIESQ